MDEDNEQWDEFRWEEFLKKDDERADRFAQIVEKYGNDPDLESILAHEMRWDSDQADFEGTRAATDDGRDGDGEGEEWKETAGLGPNEAPEQAGIEPTAADHRPHEDNLYRKAYAFAVNSREWLNRLPHELGNDADVIEISSNATIPAAKIVSAWDDDDEDRDVLGFRIAVYKRGLAAANKALQSMNSMLARNVAEKGSLLELIRQATEVRNGIALRILEVREQTGRI